jgi:hypothetical protein
VDSVEVADEIELKQGRQIERYLARGQIATHVVEPQGVQVLDLDVGIDGSHRVVGADGLLDVRQQRSLGARGALSAASAYGPPDLPTQTRSLF